MTDRAPAAASSLAIAPDSVPAAVPFYSRVRLVHILIGVIVVLALIGGWMAFRLDATKDCAAAYHRADAASQTMSRLYLKRNEDLSAYFAGTLSEDDLALHITEGVPTINAATADIKAAHALHCGR